MSSMKSKPSNLDKEPAEGSRETVDRALTQKQQKDAADRGGKSEDRTLKPNASEKK
jgi:hypothetical protein